MTNLIPHFGKTACVLDTCSIINLDDIELAGRDVLYYMRRSFDVHVCDAILDELGRHKQRLHSKESSYWPRFLSSRKQAAFVLNDDRTALESFYSAAPSFSGSDDAGERGNTRLALELLITRRFGQIVFVILRAIGRLTRWPPNRRPRTSLWRPAGCGRRPGPGP
jgi:hypothetical protein